jgi:hypothetical protein
MRFIVSVIAAICVLSCIEYEEEIWINADKSGKIKMTVGFAEDLAQMGGESELDGLSDEQFKAQADTTPGLKMIESKMYTEDETRYISMLMEFDNFEVLASLNDSEDKADMVGNMKLEKKPDGKLYFSRIISMGEEEGEQQSEEDEMASNMAAMMFGQSKWTYKVHMPGKVISANTSDKRIDKENNVVEWEVSLATLMKGPKEMTAVLEPPSALPLNLLIIIIAAGGIGLAGIVGFLVFRKKKPQTA